MKKILKEVNVGEIFNIAGFDFIKFDAKDGNTIGVAKDAWFNSVFGKNNNFAESEVLERLQKEFLPKLESIIGAENIIEHEVDLLSLDGSDKWGKVKTKVSIPTFDFYRKNVKIFDRYKLELYWWLATADAVSEHIGHDYWVSCVSPRGGVDSDIGNGNGGGVRPFLIFLSSISVS